MSDQIKLLRTDCQNWRFQYHPDSIYLDLRRLSCKLKVYFAPLLAYGLKNSQQKSTHFQAYLFFKA